MVDLWLSIGVLQVPQLNDLFQFYDLTIYQKYSDLSSFQSQITFLAQYL
jgi:hypothetical protein